MRGTMRARRVENRPTGEMGIHTRGGIHRSRVAASDEDEIKVGAKRDGTLTAMQIRVVSNTGAYGNHGGETLAASLSQSLQIYRCPNMKGTGYAVYTNIVPSGAFRGYGSSQTVFAVESAMGDLARELGMSLMELQRKNVVVPGDAVHSIWEGPSDAEIGSYGLDQCMDFVEKALASGRGSAKPEGDEWLEGKGHAIHMHDCIPPTEQRSEAHLNLRADGTYHLANGATEMGNGTITTMRQVAASILNYDCVPHRYRHRRYRPRTLRHGHLLERRHERFLQIREPRRRRSARQSCSRSPASSPPLRSINVALEDDAVECGSRKIPLSELFESVPDARHSMQRHAQGLRLAAHDLLQRPRLPHRRESRSPAKFAFCKVSTPPTPARSSTPCNAADRSKARSRRASAASLFERMVFDEHGKMVNPTFRNYRISAFADIPRTEIFFADTYDRLRSARREIRRRDPDHPGRSGPRQRTCRRHRHSFRQPAVQR